MTMNGRGSTVRARVDRDLALLHRLEEGRLGLRGGAVDLVGEHDVGEDAAGAELELVGGAVPHRHAGHVGRQEVGGELDAVPRAADRACDRLGERGLADAGDVLDEEVALGDEAHQGEVHLLALALDGALDVVDERGEEAAEGGVAARRGRRLNHGDDGTRGLLRSLGQAPRVTGSVRASTFLTVTAAPRRPPRFRVSRSGCGRARSSSCARTCGRPPCGRRVVSRARVGGRARRSSRCPTPTTCSSGSRRSTARRRPDARDVVAYLEWCRAMERAVGRGHE